jgi:hypothetical protein
MKTAAKALATSRVFASRSLTITVFDIEAISFVVRSCRNIALGV